VCPLEALLHCDSRRRDGTRWKRTSRRIELDRISIYEPTMAGKVFLLSVRHERVSYTTW
jgi:hypothetical protein